MEEKRNSQTGMVVALVAAVVCLGILAGCLFFMGMKIKGKWGKQTTEENYVRDYSQHEPAVEDTDEIVENADDIVDDIVEALPDDDIVEVDECVPHDHAHSYSSGTSTQELMDDMDWRDVVQSYIDACNSHDPDLIVSFFGPDYALEQFYLVRRGDSKLNRQFIYESFCKSMAKRDGAYQMIKSEVKHSYMANKDLVRVRFTLQYRPNGNSDWKFVGCTHYYKLIDDVWTLVGVSDDITDSKI